MVSVLERALEGSGARNHLCSIYDTTQERYAVSIPFVRIGLERGEKCFYVVDEGSDQILRAALEAQGVDAERAVGTKALVVLTKAEAYLRNGVFDPKRMFAFWRETAERARSDGFQRLRATGETDWAVRAAPGLERWIEYESTLNRKLLDIGLFALCQYDRRLFPTEVILGVMRAHPIVIFRAAVSRNAMHVSPQQLEPSRFLDAEAKRYFRNLRERGAMHRAAKERKRELQQTRGELREAQAALEQAQLGLEAQGVELQKAREPTSSKLADWAALHAMLNPREREVMALVTSGLLNKEVASLLGVAEITVKTHRRKVMRKMQAASFAELVVIAEALGARVSVMSGPKKPASVPSHR